MDAGKSALELLNLQEALREPKTKNQQTKPELMIAKALESRLVKPILQNRGWKRIRSMEYLGYGRGYILVKDDKIL